jgi:hypothetical protein
MGYEINERPFTDEDDLAGYDWDCYAVYRTIVVADGEVLGGVYQEREQAVDAGRKIAAGLGWTHSDLTHEEIQQVIEDDHRVSFSEVGVREVLYA